MSNWNWKVVRQFLKQSFDLGLSWSSCLNYLHRLGFVLKRPKKRLLKAKDEERKAFVLQYSQIREEAQKSGAKIFFVDEAHFRADADLRGKWVLKGEPALVDSTSPRWGEKACYYSGVCLESGEVEAMEIAGNSNAETSTAFLQQLRENHPGPLVVIWDNGPAHRGEAIRSYLATPDLHLRLVALPAYSPDFNADLVSPRRPQGTDPTGPLRRLPRFHRRRLLGSGRGPKEKIHPSQGLVGTVFCGQTTGRLEWSRR